MNSKKVKLNGHFTQNITQTSSQQSTQQSKITKKSPQKVNLLKKGLNKINLAQKSEFNQKRIFFFFKFFFLIRSGIIGPYHQGRGPGSIEKDSQL